MQSVSKPELKSQIENFSNFDATLTPGSGTKAVMSSIGAKSRDLYQVKPGDIHVLPGLNPRVQNQAYFDGVEVLAEDIATHGYYQDKPLAGYIAKIGDKDTIVLHDGHRRLAATLRAIEKGAPIETIPIVLKDKSNSMLDLTVGLLKSNEGQPFTVYEKAVIAKRLKGYGWDNVKIAAEMRCTSAFIGQLLTMAGAPQAIAELVQAGNMSATQAFDLLKEHGNEAAAEIATTAVNKAKAAGRTKITAKDLTPTEKRDKLAKKFGARMLKLLKDVTEHERTVKAMPEDLYGDIMALFTEIEVGVRKKPKEPKVAKAPKAAKTSKAAKKAAPKKTGGLAKAIATTTKKTDAKKEGGAEFFNTLDQQEKDRKAAKTAAKADAPSARGERRSRAA